MLNLFFLNAEMKILLSDLNFDKLLFDYRLLLYIIENYYNSTLHSSTFITLLF